MDFKDLPEIEKNKITNKIKEKYPDANINVDDIKIVKNDNNESLQLSYDDISLKIPIGKPDQQTTNEIWKMISVAAISVVSVFLGLKFNQSNDNGKFKS